MLIDGTMAAYLQLNFTWCIFTRSKFASDFDLVQVSSWSGWTSGEMRCFCREWWVWAGALSSICSTRDWSMILIHFHSQLPPLACSGTKTWPSSRPATCFQRWVVTRNYGERASVKWPYSHSGRASVGRFVFTAIRNNDVGNHSFK